MIDFQISEVVVLAHLDLGFPYSIGCVCSLELGNSESNSISLSLPKTLPI